MLLFAAASAAGMCSLVLIVACDRVASDGDEFNLREVEVDGVSPTGIAFANDRLYVADYGDQKVYAYSASGKRDRGADFDLDDDSSPQGMAFAKDRFYVVDGFDGKVYAYSASGRRDAAADFDLDDDVGNPEGISYANGRFYVVGRGLFGFLHDQKAYAYSASGQHDATADVAFAARSDFTTGIVHANDRFYVVDYADQKVYAYSASGQHDVAADFDLHADNNNPTGISHANGRFYVVDEIDGRVYVYDGSGQPLAAGAWELRVGEVGTASPLGPHPTDIAVSDGRFYVIEEAGDTVLRAYSASGQRDAAADIALSADTGNPKAIAYANGRSYVVAGRGFFRSDKAYAYSASGQRDGISDFELDADNGDATGMTYANDHFYIVDMLDEKVYVYSSSGQRDATADFALDVGNEFPNGIVHVHGRLHVVDRYDDRVYAYTFQGDRDVTADFHLRPGNGFPSGIAWANGRFHIVDQADNKVYTYTAVGIGMTRTPHATADSRTEAAAVGEATSDAAEAGALIDGSRGTKGGRAVAFAPGDTLSDLPVGFWSTDVVSHNAVIIRILGDTTVELGYGGYFDDVSNRYMCRSSEGCMVRDRVVAEGLIARSAVGEGSEDHQDPTQRRAIDTTRKADRTIENG
ncbi:MAG: hypothetical protein F4X99_17565 [Gammaproteobacteria bacterium]|nr:hypothetical protein [Gammaproteobacteria bacterium]